jgi:hypothetical protein
MTIGIGRSFAAGAAALVLLFAPGYSQAVVSGTCAPTKVAFAASNNPESPTNSRIFVSVPETTVSFVQGGSKGSCVLVQFSAHAFAEAGNSVDVRARLDGATNGLPRIVNFSSDDPGLYRTSTMIFIFRKVAPGAHTLELEFRSANGTRVEIGLHNTIVHFVP